MGGAKFALEKCTEGGNRALACSSTCLPRWFILQHYNKTMKANCTINPPTPCLWQAPASTKVIKNKLLWG